MGPGGPWSPTGIGGVHRFLNRVWTLLLDPAGANRATRTRDACRPASRGDARRRPSRRARTLRDVTADYEAFRFNTMIAKLMELTNTLFRYRGTRRRAAEWDEAIACCC